jgi:CubicO group peptidase (beta-lactamase class C family)
MRRSSALVALLLSVVVVTSASAQALPSARPEQVGLSTERLDRLSRTIRADLEKGRLPGAVALVARKGQVAYFEAFGFRDKAAGAPMPREAIFRIYSMTKPFTSAVAMMLVEDGQLALVDPVGRYLPQLAKLEVGLEKDGRLTLVPAQRGQTIQDLLRHTSGFTYGVFGKSAVKDLYTKHGVDATDHTNAALVDKLATVPLHYQPGTTWEYGRSTDVLGRVIEVVTGKPLSRVFEERLFQPLKMHDTAFSVPTSKLARLAQPLPADPDTGQPIRLLDVATPPTYEAGGQGAVATAMDYARFAQAMLNRGQLDGSRVLSRKSVELMSTDQLGGIAFRPGLGFGLGFAVRTGGGAGELGSVGEYSWGGFGGTYFWIDPKEEMIAVWMAQGPGQREHYRRLFKSLVLQAIAD